MYYKGQQVQVLRQGRINTRIVVGNEKVLVRTEELTNKPPEPSKETSGSLSNERKSYARDLMIQHGLKRWSFATEASPSRLGCCSYRNKTIYVNIHHLEKASDKSYSDTILHEIAHALVGPGHGHDATWRALCIKIGGSGARCGKCSNEESAALNGAAKWKASCSKCNKDFYKHRTPSSGLTGWKCFCKTPISWSRVKHVSNVELLNSI